MVAKPPLSIEDLDEKDSKGKNRKVEKSVRGSLSYVDNGRPLPESFDKGDEIKKEVLGASTEKRPGGLTYSDAKGKLEKSTQRVSKEEKSSKVKTLLLPIVVAVALSAIMLVQFAPTKVDLYRVDNKVIAVSDSNSIQSSALQVERGRIDNIINNQGVYATKSSVNDEAQQIKVLSDRIAKLEQKLNSLGVK